MYSWKRCKPSLVMVAVVRGLRATKVLLILMMPSSSRAYRCRLRLPSVRLQVSLSSVKESGSSEAQRAERMASRFGS